MGREEHCKQISLVFVGTARSVWATLGLPLLMTCVCFSGLYCSGSRLLCQGAVKAGSGLHALPTSMLLSFRFSGTPQRHRLSWACVFCLFQVQAAQATRYLASTLFPAGRCILSPPGPSLSVSWVHSGSAVSGVLCVCSGLLMSGCDPPDGCQPSRIPGRLG